MNVGNGFCIMDGRLAPLLRLRACAFAVLNRTAVEVGGNLTRFRYGAWVRSLRGRIMNSGRKRARRKCLQRSGREERHVIPPDSLQCRFGTGMTSLSARDGRVKLDLRICMSEMPSRDE